MERYPQLVALHISAYGKTGLELPFKIFKITAGGGDKAELNLRAEHTEGTDETDGTTTTETETVDFEVVLPANGWNITLV